MAYHEVSHTFGAGYSEQHARNTSRHWFNFMRRHANPVQKAGFFLVGAPYRTPRMIVREGRKGNLEAVRGMLGGSPISSARAADPLPAAAERARASAAWLGRVFAVLLGAAHAWVSAREQAMNTDGISYLDMGDAFVRGDWAAAVSSVWSPLYAWILGLAVHLAEPSMRQEFPLVHAVNFCIYLAALGAFEFLWRQLLRAREAAEAPGMPAWAVQALGQVLFVWCSLTLIEMWAVTPDMLMSVFVYLAAGLALRMRGGGASLRGSLLLGLTLGLGYLAKAVMFPLALALLCLLALTSPRRAGGAPRLLAALLVFLAVAVPNIAAIRAWRGKLTFGDAGRLTYARYVDGVPYPHWQGEVPGSGTPVHPTRRILDEPAIYEFATPVAGTYPVGFDPSYWYEGLEVRPRPARQLRRVLAAGTFYFDLLCVRLGGLLAGLLVLHALTRRSRDALPARLGRWSLALWAACALGLYSLVYVEGRYVGAFVVVLFADLLGNARPEPAPRTRRLATAVAVIGLLFTLGNLADHNLRGLGLLTRSVQPFQDFARDDGPPPRRPWEVAETLREAGLAPGDRVAVIGHGFQCAWARLARVRIVAEMMGKDTAAMWFGEDVQQRAALAAFASAGARAVVAEEVPARARLAGWRRVGRSSTWIRYLDGPPAPGD